MRSYRVEWGVRHDTGTENERVCHGSIVLGKTRAEDLYEQLCQSFGAQSPTAKLTWGNTRLGWEDSLRIHWVTIETL